MMMFLRIDIHIMVLGKPSLEQDGPISQTL